MGSTLVKILEEPQTSGNAPPDTFARVIRKLMDQGDKQDADPGREKAMAVLNVALAREGYEAFYAEDRQCHLKHIATNTIAQPVPNPHRPFSATELRRRGHFHRITAAGHKDKALEYGKDIWMKYTLPTMHTLYFGIQAKKDKLDAAGDSNGSNKNIAEVYQQALMMLGHEIFAPETNSRVLVDHAFIVAGGEITKAAKNWLGGKLDATKRSQIMFMDRGDILNLYVVTYLPLPDCELP